MDREVTAKKAPEQRVLLRDRDLIRGKLDGPALDDQWITETSQPELGLRPVHLALDQELFERSSDLAIKPDRPPGLEQVGGHVVRVDIAREVDEEATATEGEGTMTKEEQVEAKEENEAKKESEAKVERDAKSLRRTRKKRESVGGIGG